MNLRDVAGDIMDRYEKNYQNLKEQYENTLKGNEKYNDEVKKERDRSAVEEALEKAIAMKESYIKSLKDKIDKKEKEFKRNRERELAKRETKPTNEKLLNSMELLLTQQIINGGNEQQIQDHLKKNIDLENEEVVKLMSYYYSDKEGTDEIRKEINEFLTPDQEKLEQLRGLVKHWEAISEEIRTGLEVTRAHNFYKDFRYNSNNPYFK